MTKVQRIPRPVAVFRVEKGCQVALNGEPGRVLAVCSEDQISVRLLRTSETRWACVSELQPWDPPSRDHVRHPSASNPDEELRAARWVAELQQLAQQPSPESKAQVAVRLDVTVRTVERHLATYLLDPTPGAQLAGVPGPCPGSRRLSPAKEACIAKAIEEVYLTRERAPISAVELRVKALCRSAGLGKPPLYSTIRKRVYAGDPLRSAKRRLGADEGAARQAPAIRGVVAPTPLSLVQIDHAQVDVMVVSATTRQEIGRPWITIAIDVCTRCVVGYHLSLDYPNQTSVGLCLEHACLPKERWLERLGVDVHYPVYGRMQRISWDNAKTFLAHNVGIQCQRYGIEVIPRPVRKPHYGAYIERYIGTYMGKVHWLPGTTFSNSKVRGDYDSERRAVMTMAELQRWTAYEIAGVYHNRPHAGLRKRTPLQAWKAGWQRPNGEVRLPPMISDPRVFVIGFLPSVQRKVRRDGVHYANLRYWDAALTTLINDRKKHTFHYHQGDLSRLFLDDNGTYVDIPLLDRSRAPFSALELKDARDSLPADSLDRQSEQALLDAVERNREIVDAAVAKSRVARRKQAQRPEAPPKSEASVDYSQPAIPWDPASAEVL